MNQTQLRFQLFFSGIAKRQNRHPDLSIRTPKAEDEAQVGRVQRRGLPEPQEIRGRKVRRNGLYFNL